MVAADRETLGSPSGAQTGKASSHGAAWSTKRYLNIELLKDQQMRGAITA